MSLEFELELSHGEASKLVMGHEPNNELWRYKMVGDKFKNDLSLPNVGTYNDLDWKNKFPLMTSAPIENFGVKHLPRYGAYGFYTKLGQPTSHVLLPIHIKHDKEKPPTVDVTISDDNIKFEIIGKYDCYRIELPQGYFTQEYVVYAKNEKAETMIPFSDLDEFLNDDAANIVAIVTGYKNEISVFSESVEKIITISGRGKSWFYLTLNTK